MKFLIVSLLSVVLGCSAENSVPDKTPDPISNRDYSLGPSSGDHGVPCPSPLLFTTVKNGKEIRVRYDFPCSPGTYNTSKASDPPGWGTDENVSGTKEVPEFNPNNIPGDPAVDPVPRKF